ncbi:MAG: TSUP family transporter [Erysipelotrichaceae bacterium]
MSALWILGPLVFLAGFIDSIAGGGGLISLPAYLLAGVPIHIAMGTNKVSSSLGTLVASITYFLHHQILKKLALFASIFALLGSYLGSSLALMMNANSLKGLMLILLPIMALFLIKQKPSTVDYQEKPIPWLIIALITFSIGLYDGLIGPGTGSLLIYGFVSIIHLNYTQASANAKVVNLASGIASIIAFGISNQINLPLGLAAAVFSIVGNTVGSLFALRFGKRIIQPLLLIVFGLIMLKLLLDLI